MNTESERTMAKKKTETKRETEREKYARQERMARRMGLITDQMLRRPARFFSGMDDGDHGGSVPEGS